MTSRADGTVDRLWVPLLTHFRRGDGGGTRVDGERTVAHLRALRPHVRQFLLAGSTGDGWDLTTDHFDDLLRLTRRAEAFAGCRLLIGVLRPTTEAVVAWARRVEHELGRDRGSAGAYVGLAVCPPVDPGASQAAILAHYRAVLAATTSDLAVYQLPQVTGCAIEPDTMRILAAEPRVTMFKDTSGGDAVARSGLVSGLTSGLTMVRGAEGGYVDALRPTGGYDGWLLSTGNAFGPLLRRMLDLHAAGQSERAGDLSAVMTRMVDALFREAGALRFGNPFSNANKAADHLLAAGWDWREAPPPVTVGGHDLPLPFLEAVEDLIGHFPMMTGRGYAA